MELIEDYSVSSAYDFPIPTKIFHEVIKEANIVDLVDDDIVISKLIESFGSDRDLIRRCINIQYPLNEYFTVIDYNGVAFRIRIWKWKDDMSFKDAKDIIYEYLRVHIDSDVQILGEHHPYNNTTVGEIRKAFNMLKYNYNWFGGD